MGQITIKKDLNESIKLLQELIEFCDKNPDYVEVSCIEDDVSLMLDEIKGVHKGHAKPE